MSVVDVFIIFNSIYFKIILYLFIKYRSLYKVFQLDSLIYIYLRIQLSNNYLHIKGSKHIYIIPILLRFK